MARIGIDCRLWNETGVGRYIRNLVFSLAKIDTQNTYILFLRNNEYTTLKVPGKNFEKRLADIHWHTIEEQTVFPKILKNEKLDVMHFPYFSIPVFYKGKFVVTIHDLILNHFPTGKASTLPTFIYWIKQAAYRYVMHFAIKNSQKVIAVSNATAQEIASHYNISKEKIVVTYEGVDNHIAAKNIKNTFQSPYFLYVGNAYPHKNLETLLESFSELMKNRKENVYLYLVGKNDFFWEKVKQHVKKLNLIDKIIFLESVSDETLAALYKYAEALVLPSLMEGFGLPAIEAMAQHCLVLASDIPSFREICGDSAFYFDPHSPTSIVKAMQAVLEREITISEKKKKGLQYAREFSWEKMAKETEKIYEDCISL
ncbi:MAG TPA: glycosyltransferase family 1 protein [Patescibacteria group bacterium]